jgi:hypothetical protein
VDAVVVVSAAGAVVAGAVVVHGFVRKKPGVVSVVVDGIVELVADRWVVEGVAVVVPVRVHCYR